MIDLEYSNGANSMCLNFFIETNLEFRNANSNTADSFSLDNAKVRRFKELVVL